MTTVSLNKCEKIVCRGDLKLNDNSIRDVSNIYFSDDSNYISTISQLNSRIDSVELGSSLSIDSTFNQIETSLNNIDLSLNSKYDKSGGLINGNVDISGLFNLDNKFVNDGNNIIVKTNIIPDVSNVYTLGSIDKPFMDLFLGPSSLYINGTKIISADDAAEMKFETTANQNLTLLTKGTGVFKLQSNDDININSVGNNSDINLNATGGDIKLNTAGGIKIDSTLGLVFASNKGIKYQSNQIVLSGDVLIDGSLNVMGGQTVINTEQLAIKDNIVVLNSNQQSNPAVGFQSGFEVIRGNRPKYNLKFRDLGVSGGVFEIGEDDNLQPVATRKSSEEMTTDGFVYWNANNNRFETFSNVKNNNGNIELTSTSKILVNGVDVLSVIDSSLNNVYTKLETDNLISGFSHTTEISDVSGLQTVLDSKAVKANVDASLNNIYTKSETNTLLNNKANTAHTHVINDVSGLQTALDSKAVKANVDASLNNIYTKSAIDASFNNVYTKSAVDNLLNNISGGSNISDISGLQTALDGKLSLSGGTMSGSINMNTNFISNSKGMYFSDGSFIGSNR